MSFPGRVLFLQLAGLSARTIHEDTRNGTGFVRAVGVISRIVPFRAETKPKTKLDAALLRLHLTELACDPGSHQSIVFQQRNVRPQGRALAQGGHARKQEWR